RRHRWWHPPVHGIHDQRRAPVGGDLQPPRVHPVFVVGAVHVGGIAAVAPIAREIEGQRLLEIFGLFVAEDVLLTHFGRPLERRAGGVVPYPLQIGIAPRRLRRDVFLRRLAGGGHDETRSQYCGE